MVKLDKKINLFFKFIVENVSYDFVRIVCLYFLTCNSSSYSSWRVDIAGTQFSCFLLTHFPFPFWMIWIYSFGFCFRQVWISPGFFSHTCTSTGCSVVWRLFPQLVRIFQHVTVVLLRIARKSNRKLSFSHILIVVTTKSYVEKFELKATLSYSEVVLENCWWVDEGLGCNVTDER